MSRRSERFLAAYAGVLTLTFAAVVLTGATSSRKATFDEIDVQRINVREPDGTTRLVIASKARFPDVIEMDGVSRRHVRENAGLLFYNDEGVENGGLVWAGSRTGEAPPEGFVHLSMDQYKQDQVVTLQQAESAKGRRAGLTVSDRPDFPIMRTILEREQLEKILSPEEFEARMARANDDGRLVAQRVFVGKNEARESLVELGDARNRPRMRLRVTADGAASIEFLDAGGAVTASLSEADLARRSRD